MRAAEDSHLAGDRFDTDAMVTALKEETERSLRDGHTGLRVSGEMSWALPDRPGTVVRLHLTLTSATQD